MTKSFTISLKAQNVFLNKEKVEGKGRPFKARFLEAGLVEYDFGLCLLTKQVIEKFVYDFKGCPVVIDHKDVTEENKAKTVKGNISDVYFDEKDGWYWCDGIITDNFASKLVEDDGYNVSCQYAITEYRENRENKRHNGVLYDIEILNGAPEHLAIVSNPRYENAYIAVNAICKNEFIEEEHKRDEEGKFTDNKDSAYEKFNQEIDKIKTGNYPRGKQITVSEKPSDVWIKAGLQNKKIVMPAAVFYKATAEKHNVDEKTIRNFPELLKDPPFIFKSSTEQGSFVGVLDAVEKDGNIEKPLIVAVKPIKDRVEVNIITSTYGKDKDFVNRETQKGNLIYKREKTASNSVVALLATETLKPSINIISDLKTDFKPTDTIKLIKNYIKKEGVQMTAELKTKFNAYLGSFKAANAQEKDNRCQNDDEGRSAERTDSTDKRHLIDEIGGILKGKVDEELWRTIIGKAEKLAYEKSEKGTADNSEDEEENEAKNKKAKNEDVDKREIIRKIMAIAGEHEDDEDVRTIAKLAEKLAYEDSERGTADNKAKNKCRNEEEEPDEEGRKEKYEEFKKEVADEVENRMAKNSLEYNRSLFFDAEEEKRPLYESREDRLLRGNRY